MYVYIITEFAVKESSNKYEICSYDFMWKHFKSFQLLALLGQMRLSMPDSTGQLVTVR